MNLPPFEPLSITQQELFKTIKSVFECNYETFDRQSVVERGF